MKDEHTKCWRLTSVIWSCVHAGDMVHIADLNGRPLLPFPSHICIIESISFHQECNIYLVKKSYYYFAVIFHDSFFNEAVILCLCMLSGVHYFASDFS